MLLIIYGTEILFIIYLFLCGFGVLLLSLKLDNIKIGFEENMVVFDTVN